MKETVPCEHPAKAPAWSGGHIGERKDALLGACSGQCHLTGTHFPKAALSEAEMYPCQFPLITGSSYP